MIESSKFIWIENYWLQNKNYKGAKGSRETGTALSAYNLFLLSENPVMDENFPFLYWFVFQICYTLSSEVLEHQFLVCYCWWGCWPWNNFSENNVVLLSEHRLLKRMYLECDGVVKLCYGPLAYIWHFLKLQMQGHLWGPVGKWMWH